MTTRTTRLLLLITLCATGCSQQPAEEQVNRPGKPPAVVVIPEPTGSMTADDELGPQPKPPEPPPPPPAFKFTPDLAGQAVAKAVTPDVSRPLPGERFGTEPRPRAVPAKLLEPSALRRAAYVPPPLLPAKPTGANPDDPPEAVPLNLGAGADAPPAKPVLPVAKVETPRARDVNLPPPAPSLGRPATDRVPFDDPTNDLGNATVVASPPVVSSAPSGFLKVAIPDPFELGAQVKPRVPTASEPAAAPVVVNPQRVK